MILRYFAFTCWLLFATSTAVPASDISADDVAYRVYHRDVGKDMQMTGTMELISSSGQKRVREYLSMRLDTPDERKVLIRFTSPADIAGTAFLVREDLATDTTEQHLYLPALKRTRRIVASQQGRSFVNTDFTFEDMRRQPLAEWNYRLDEPTEYQGRPSHTLISTPKSGTDSQYSRIVSLIDKQTFMPLKIDFFDDRERHSKTYRVTAVALIDGIATEMEVIMEDLRSKHSTRLVTHQIRYNSGLQEHLFTTRALEQ